MAATKEFRNKRAFFEYLILEKCEAGIALRGTEIKSIREGSVNLAESYVRPIGEELFLVNCHIPEYKAAGWTNHDPLRPRKLLLHRRELDKLLVKVQEKGLTLIPLRLYFNGRGFAKLEVGLGRGKKLHDKRADMKRREADREIRRQMAGPGSAGGELRLPGGLMKHLAKQFNCEQQLRACRLSN
jgi:SsrA-binding protein